MAGNSMRHLLAALHACLRPFARVLLNCGIGYREFAEIAKLAFVQEAIERQKGDKIGVVNVSRLAVQTGLSRKELARMRDHLQRESGRNAPSEGVLAYVSRGARVMQLWYSDPRFIDKNGEPLVLDQDGPTNSFAALAKLAGGDIPAGAVKAELLAAGAAEELADGRLLARSRHFIPVTASEEVVLGLSQFVYPVLTGLANNLDPNQEPLLQRVAYTHRLGEESGQLFRKFARSRSVDFVETIDDWLTAKEIPPDQAAPVEAVHLVGVFYFEGRIPTPNEVRSEARNPTGG